MKPLFLNPPAKNISQMKTLLEKRSNLAQMKPIKLLAYLKTFQPILIFIFDFLFSYSTLTKEWGEAIEISWNWFDFYTYIKTIPGTDADALEAQFPEFVDKYKLDSESNTGMIHKFFLQPLTDIHLHSNLGWEAEPNGNARSVYFLLIIALFILVIAWINYINLATARATERAREVGMRKVTGATRGRLIRQFLLESMTLNLIAGIIAFGMVELAQGYFEQISGEVISISLWNSYQNWMILMGVFLFGTLLAGAYPAFVLSSFQPALVLKGTHLGVGKGGLLRKGVSYLPIRHFLGVDDRNHYRLSAG